jgi:hypothetical protein
VHSPLLAVIDDQAATTADPGIVEQQMGAIGRMLCRGAGAYIPDLESAPRPWPWGIRPPPLETGHETSHNLPSVPFHTSLHKPTIRLPVNRWSVAEETTPRVFPKVSSLYFPDYGIYG